MKVNKIIQAFDSFLDKRIVPLDKKIIIAIFAVVIILPCVAFYFLHFSPKTKEIKNLENQKTAREEICGSETL